MGKKDLFSDSVHVNVHILPGYLEIQILTFFFLRYGWALSHLLDMS